MKPGRGLRMMHAHVQCITFAAWLDEEGALFVERKDMALWTTISGWILWLVKVTLAFYLTKTTVSFLLNLASCLLLSMAEHPSICHNLGSPYSEIARFMFYLADVPAVLAWTFRDARAMYTVASMSASDTAAYVAEVCTDSSAITHDAHQARVCYIIRDFAASSTGIPLAYTIRGTVGLALMAASFVAVSLFMLYRGQRVDTAAEHAEDPSRRKKMQ